jgi:hypothetical protein
MVEPATVISAAIGIARELVQQAFSDIASEEIRPAVSLIRQLRTEVRGAGGAVSTSSSRLREAIGAVVLRLAGEADGSTHMTRLVGVFGSRFVVAASVLGDTDVRSCLQQPEIQRYLTEVIFSSLRFGQIDRRGSHFERVVALCATRLQRGAVFPEFLVELVASVALASVTSGLSLEEDLQLCATQGLAGQVHAVGRQIRALDARLGASAVQPLATAECRRALQEALLIRTYDPQGAADRVVKLGHRVAAGGDLTTADVSIRAEVFYWAARLAEGLKKDRPLSGRFLGYLQETGVDIDIDLRVIDALRVKNDGRPDVALDVLSGIDTPDSRAVFMDQLRDHSGDDAVVSWFELHPPLEPLALAPHGWAQIARLYANRREFATALELIAKLDDLALSQLPHLFLLRGRCVSHPTFPEDAWSYLGEQPLYTVAVPLLESAGARAARRAALADFRLAEVAFRRLGFEPGVRTARAEIAWCQLNDPPERAEAVEIIQENVDSLEWASSFLNLANEFDVCVETLHLDRQIELKLLGGGLRKAEIHSYVALLRLRKAYPRLIDYLTDNAKRIRSDELLSPQL